VLSSAALPASTCIFNDVTSGNNAVPGEPGYGTASSALYQSGTGYDLATGLGSVNVTNLVNQWNTVTFSPTSTAFPANIGLAAMTDSEALGAINCAIMKPSLIKATF
jgi:hypothetical protein